MRIFIAAIILSLTGCGDYGDRLDQKMINQYTYDCRYRGFKNIEITYIMGKPSAYYRCF